jgi:hypothetical protein
MEGMKTRRCWQGGLARGKGEVALGDEEKRIGRCKTTRTSHA